MIAGTKKMKMPEMLQTRTAWYPAATAIELFCQSVLQYTKGLVNHLDLALEHFLEAVFPERHLMDPLRLKSLTWVSITFNAQSIIVTAELQNITNKQEWDMFTSQIIDRKSSSLVYFWTSRESEVVFNSCGFSEKCSIYFPLVDFSEWELQLN